MIKLHEYNETQFGSGCLAYLSEAEKVAVTENLQQEHTLTFEYPLNLKAEMILDNRIVSVEGQAYRINNVKIDYSGTRVLTVTAMRIFHADAQRHHIPTIGNDTDEAESTIGCDPKKVLIKAIEGTQFELIPDTELADMGMTRIGADGTRIDFLPTDKVNTYDAIMAVIEAYGRGELYVDNYRFAVVERIGKDNGVRLTTGKNLSKLTVERQTTELCTRLYAYGKDDLTFSSVNGGIPYVDSVEAIEKYGIIEGYKDYSDYTEPEKLLAHAEWDLMGADNENRLDTPQYTITGEVIELSKHLEYGSFEKIALGDTVRVREKPSVIHKKRIISITYYPYSGDKPVVTIGSQSNTDPFFAVWQRASLLKSVKKNITTTSKKIKGRSLSGSVNTSRNSIQSDNGQLTIVGDLLTIGNGKNIRAQIGNKNGEFICNIFNTKSERVLYINSDGNVVIEQPTISIDGSEVATKNDINSIENNIETLKEKIEKISTGVVDGGKFTDKL